MMSESTDVRKDFGAKLRAVRVSRGLSQEALGIKLGIKKAQISRWENLRDVPRPQSVAKLAEALGVPVTALQDEQLMNIDAAGSLGDRIRMLRKQRRWTLRELAVLVDVSHVTITQWENDTCLPRLSKVKRLASLFEVSADFLIDGVT